MKILDWYIIRKFIGTYFYAIILIVGIAVIFDLAEKIDDFLEKDAPMYDIPFQVLPQFYTLLCQPFQFPVRVHSRNIFHFKNGL